MLSKNRNVGLDVMRASAIVLVLMFHWLGVSGHYYNVFSIFGFYGVEIFFVLSGFLIGNILIKSYLNEKSFNLRIILNFWNRRWLRTLPLYLFILLVYVIYFSLKGIPFYELWKYFFFVQNMLGYNPNNHDFYGVSWSLSIEEWFYLSFPVILFILNLLSKRFLSKLNILSITIFVFIAGSLLIRFIYSQHVDYEWNNQFRKAIICREDSISFGVLGALVHNLRGELLKKWRICLGLSGACLLLIGAIVFTKDVANNYSGFTNNVSTFSKTVLFTIVSLGVLLALPYFYYFKVNNAFAVKSISFISKISYSLYLVHPFVLDAVSLIKPSKNVLLILLSLLIFSVSSILLAMLTYNFIEQTFLKIRDRYFNEKYKPI